MVALVPTSLAGHTIGYGFVGRHLAQDLLALAAWRSSTTARTVWRGCTPKASRRWPATPTRGVLEAAGVGRAERLLVALPNVFEAGQIVARGRKANPALHICARAETEAEAPHLREHGADTVVLGRLEIAAVMLKDAFPAAAGPLQGSEIKLAGRSGGCRRVSGGPILRSCVGT